jgi:flavin-dependent dehydrogenase
MRRSDPLILGGGPAGAAAAIMLARGGARPTILERTRETGDALCGGFLSWHTLATLDRLGVDWPALGGHRVDTLRLYAGHRHADARLPGGAIGLSRRALDSALQAQAERCGAKIERGVIARRIEQPRRAVLSDGAIIETDSLFLASGKHDIGGAGRPRDAHDPAMGLRTRLRLSPAGARDAAGRIELHLFEGGYAGLVLQEDGSANLCLAARKSRLTAAGGRPDALLAALARDTPSLGDVMGHAVDATPVEAIGAVPYGWRTDATLPGMFRLGDQAAVIPSLAGEGIGIALASGEAGAAAWLVHGPGGSTAFQRSSAARTRRPVLLAGAIWHLCERPFTATLATRLVAFAPAIAARVASATRIGH